MKLATLKTSSIVLLSAALGSFGTLKAQASPAGSVVITENSSTQLTVSVNGGAAVTETTAVPNLWVFFLALPGLVPGSYLWGWAVPRDSTPGNTTANGVIITEGATGEI